MPPLSVFEAISPAFRHTKALLLRSIPLPRRWKLATAAYMGRMASSFFLFPMMACVVPFLFSPGWKEDRVWILMLMVPAFFFCIWFGYLCSGLEFTTFDSVLLGEELVAPSWRRHRNGFRKMFVLKAVIGLMLSVIPAVGFFVLFKPLFQGTTPPSQLPFDTGRFLLYWSMACFGILAMIVVSMAVSDLFVPTLALEGGDFGAAWDKVRELFVAAPGAYLAFLCAKNILGIIGLYAVILLAEIPLLIVVIILAFLGAALIAILHAVGVSHIITETIVILGGIMLYGTVLWAILFAAGVWMQFLDAWTIFFLAGRYPRLGGAFKPQDYTPPPAFVPQNWPLPYHAPPPSWPPAPPKEGRERQSGN